MVWRILRKQGVIPLVLILAALAYWGLHSRPPKFISVGYIADRDVTLWNTLAEVKQPVSELHYGDRVEVIREEGITSQVRTASGQVGWLLDSRQLMDAELWGQSAALLAHARTLPVQARGQTKTVSNVRIEPGRNGKRVFQLTRGTPVVVLERTLADAAPPDENSQDEKNSSTEQQKPKQEDWLLIMRSADGDLQPNAANSPGNPISAENSSSSGNPSATPASGDPVSGGPVQQQTTSPTEDATVHLPATPIAGWVLARFIEFNLPGPVRDYASSADLHVVAWFELNRVPDGSGGEAPQYLVAGSRGGEGQTCDFTMLRVYTWGTARKRYETAYVESDLCGRLPIRVSQNANGPEFHFSESGDTPEERTYVMRQTVVRRVKNDSEEKSSKRRSRQ